MENLKELFFKLLDITDKYGYHAIDDYESDEGGYDPFVVSDYCVDFADSIISVLEEYNTDIVDEWYNTRSD